MVTTMYLLQVGYFVAAITLLRTAVSATPDDNCSDLCNVTIAVPPEAPKDGECTVQGNATYNFSACFNRLKKLAKKPRELNMKFLRFGNVSYGEQAIAANLLYLGEINAALETTQNLNQELKAEYSSSFDIIYCTTKRGLMKLTLLVKLKKQVNTLSNEYSKLSNKTALNPGNITLDAYVLASRRNIVYLLRNITMDILSSKECNDTKVDNLTFVKALHDTDWYEELIEKEEELIAIKIEKRRIINILIHNVQPILSAVMFLLGCSLNVLLLMIFARHPESRAPRNMILLQLAVGDTLSLIVNLLIYNALVFQDILPGDQPVLKFFEFVRYMCFSISVFSVVALCFQRYCATLKLTNRGMILRQSTRFSSTIVISTVWLFAIAMAVYHGFLCLGQSCYSNLGDKESVHNLSYVLDFVFLACIPLLLVAILSILTVRHFQKRLGQLKTSLPPDAWQELRQALERSTAVLRLTPVVFGISFLPFYLIKVTVVWLHADINSVWYNCFKVLTYILVFMQTCFNPISLYVTSSTFRGYFHSHVSCQPHGYRRTYRFDLQPEYGVTLEGRHSIPEEAGLKEFGLQTRQQ